MLLVLTAIDVPYQDVSLLWAIDWFVDRCRTTNNLLGDCYGAAVVEALSRDDLRKMDEEKERKEREEAKEKEAMGKITVVVEGGSPVSRKEDNDNNGNCNGGGAKKINNNLEGAQGALKANWSQVTNTTVVKVRKDIVLVADFCSYGFCFPGRGGDDQHVRRGLPLRVQRQRLLRGGPRRHRRRQQRRRRRRQQRRRHGKHPDVGAGRTAASPFHPPRHPAQRCHYLRRKMKIA